MHDSKARGMSALLRDWALAPLYRAKLKLPSYAHIRLGWLQAKAKAAAAASAQQGLEAGVQQLSLGGQGAAVISEARHQIQPAAYRLQR